MELKVTFQNENTVCYGMFDGEVQASRLSTSYVRTRYCDKYLNTVMFGGAGTDPQYRRTGCIRTMFDRAIADAMERGQDVIILHPFSFAYYRKFGFEKVSDHLIIEFPMSAISYIERNPDFIPYTDKEKQLPDLCAVYNEFSKCRNLMPERTNGARFPLGGAEKTFIHYKDGKADAFLTVNPENYYEINRMVSVNLHVTQFAFTSKEALNAIFGFIRMYEGEMDSVKIHNAAMCPEVEMLLRNYFHTKYTVVPDVMARIINVENVIAANDFHGENGEFTLRVNDIYEQIAGNYHIKYSDGDVKIEKLPLSDNFDICADIRALAQLLYGYNGCEKQFAAYTEGVEVRDTKGTECFFDVFRKKYGGVFEHF